ncbi:MAG: Lar family restriction alleviation protein [Synergistaceae bacterium]|nr:Lar family restriction alleviation protein [Synergistaceae bacterium]
MAKENLKPCPFCGSDNIREYFGYPVMHSVIKCADCGGRMVISGTPQKAAQFWNRRTSREG